MCTEGVIHMTGRGSLERPLPRSVLRPMSGNRLFPLCVTSSTRCSRNEQMSWPIGHSGVAPLRFFISFAPLHHAHAPCWSLTPALLVTRTVRYKATCLPQYKSCPQQNSTDLVEPRLNLSGLENSTPTVNPGRRSTVMELASAIPVVGYDCSNFRTAVGKTHLHGTLETRHAIRHPTTIHTSPQSHDREQTRSEIS